MSNLSVLERNIIHGLGAYDCAEECADLFLRRIDKDGVLVAEDKANKWGVIGPFLSKFIPVASDIYESQGVPLSDESMKDLRGFMKKRVENLA